MKLSEYLSVEEATKSPTAIRQGIDNTPTPDQLENMRYVALEIFDKVREFAGGPLHASSFFRSPLLNSVIGGSSKTSQHMLGCAIDLDTDTFNNGTNIGIFNFIKDNLEFDQLILEYPSAEGIPSWVHVSKCRPPKKNRKEILVKLKSKYIPFSEYKTGMI